MQRRDFFSIPILSLLVLSCAGTATQPPQPPVHPVEPTVRKLTNDVAWVRQSVEYRALCEQTYRAAWRAVKARTATLSEPWAVVLDVDETVLDNSEYQLELWQRGEAFTPESWDVWTKRRTATPIAGVKAFLDSVRALGPDAHVVFITNRLVSQEADTRLNLQQHDLWNDKDLLLCRRDRPDGNKTFRRDEVRTGTGRADGRGPRRLVAFFGDQIGDMIEPADGLDAAAIIARYSQRPEWGVSWFMLPNPMYGSWERGY